MDNDLDLPFWIILPPTEHWLPIPLKVSVSPFVLSGPIHKSL